MVEVTIFSLNTHLFFQSFLGFFYKKILYQDEPRYQRICQYIRSTSPTIVFLSEVWAKSIKTRFVEDLRNIYPYSWIPVGKTIKLGPEFVILSKIPITNPVFENFNDLSSWDWFSEKRVCGFTSGNTFYCCTHLDTSTEQIYSNLEQVIGFIRRHGEGKSVLLAGDFNLAELLHHGQPQQDPEYIHAVSRLQTVNLIDAQRVIYPSAVQQPLYTVDGAGNATLRRFSSDDNTSLRRIDFFFSRGIIPTQTSVIPSDMSDHYGTTITIHTN